MAPRQGRSRGRILLLAALVAVWIAVLAAVWLRASASPEAAGPAAASDRSPAAAGPASEPHTAVRPPAAGTPGTGPFAR